MNEDWGTRVIVADINEDMLREGEKRARETTVYGGSESFLLYNSTKPTGAESSREEAEANLNQ